MAKSLDELREDIFKVMKWAFGTNEALELRDNQQPEKWLTPKRFSETYNRFTAAKAEDLFYKHLKRRLNEELYEVGGKDFKDEAKLAIQDIFSQEVRLMKAEDGQTKFVINVNVVEQSKNDLAQYIEPKAADAAPTLPNKAPKTAGREPTNSTKKDRNPATSEVTLKASVARMNGVKLGFYEKKLPIILNGLILGTDYRAPNGTSASDPIFLTPSGQRKTLDIVKNLLKPKDEEIQPLLQEFFGVGADEEKRNKLFSDKTKNIS